MTKAVQMKNKNSGRSSKSAPELFDFTAKNPLFKDTKKIQEQDKGVAKVRATKKWF